MSDPVTLVLREALADKTEALARARYQIDHVTSDLAHHVTNRDRLSAEIKSIDAEIRERETLHTRAETNGETAAAFGVDLAHRSDIVATCVLTTTFSSGEPPAVRPDA